MSFETRMLDTLTSAPAPVLGSFRSVLSDCSETQGISRKEREPTLLLIHHSHTLVGLSVLHAYTHAHMHTPLSCR